MKKKRVDVLLVNQGLFDTREKAKRSVMAGEILGNNEERLDKPGVKIDIDTDLHIKGKHVPYVSRGGFKLEKALSAFDINITDRIVLDIGSSTGGFTDVMLQNNAALIYALDVGSNQLVWSLRNNNRVVVMEHTNFRYCKSSDFSDGLPSFASIDVSFISLRLILPPLQSILVPEGEVVALIKPQFEAGRKNVGKHGIIHDAKIHESVINKVLVMAKNNGFVPQHLDFSPITGGDGNIEFLIHLKKTNGDSNIFNRIIVREVVKSAHRILTTQNH